MTMNVSLEELVSQLKDEIFEEPEAADDSVTDDQDEIDIENDFCVKKSDFNPVTINDTSKNNSDTNISSKYKLVPVYVRQDNNKLPIIVLKRDKIAVFNNAIKNDVLHNLSTTKSQNPNQILDTTQTKPTNAPAELKLGVSNIKNVSEPKTNNSVPIKVKDTNDKEATSVKDTSKQAELELQVKLLKDLLDDALSKIPAEASERIINTEIYKATTKNTTDFPESQPKFTETQHKVTEKQPKVIEKHAKLLKTTETPPKITVKLNNELLKDFFDNSLSSTGSSSKRKIAENIDETSRVELGRNESGRIPQAWGPLRPRYRACGMTHVGPCRGAGKRHPVCLASPALDTFETTVVPEKQPKLIDTGIEKQPQVTEKVSKNYYYEVMQNQHKVIEVQPIKTVNPFKNAAQRVHYYEVTEKQLKLIENGLKIAEAQPITTENPSKHTENLKVKLLEDFLEPKQVNTENSFEISTNTDLELKSKIIGTQTKMSENPIQIIDDRITIYSKQPHPTATVLGDKNVHHKPVIKIKAGNLKKIDLKQLQDMTETNIYKYIANAASTIAHSSNSAEASPVTKKTQLPVKLPQERKTNSPNGESAVNTPAVKIIANELLFTRNTVFGYINKTSEPVPVVNARNSMQLDQRIKLTELNTNRIIDAAGDTFEDQILGHTEIVNEDVHINMTDALESTAEVTIKDEVHIQHDPFETEVQETNGDSVQVVNVTDPLFIKQELDNAGQKQQRIDKEKVLIKSIKAKPIFPCDSVEHQDIRPTFCKICQMVFFTEHSLKNHKHEYLKCECRKEFGTQKALEDHKLKEHSRISLVQSKPKHQKQKKKFCRKCAKALSTNVSLDNHKHSHLKCCKRQFCTQKSLEHKLKDHPITRANYAESSNNVKPTKDISEVMEINSEEVSTHDQQIGNTRIDKGTRKEQNTTITRKNKKVSPYIVKRIYPNIDSLNSHITRAHQVIPKGKPKERATENNWTWHLIQKTALFKCDNCNLHFSQYPEKHYEFCQQNKAVIGHTECKDCHKKISFNYQQKVQDIDVNHKFQHILGYKLNTIPINFNILKFVTECPICHFHYFYDKQRLVTHIKYCRGRRCAEHKCCGFVFDKHHLNIHTNYHTHTNIVLNYDMLIKKTLEELPSEDEGSLITIDELKQLHTADSNIIYAYGDKYRMVNPNEFMILQARSRAVSETKWTIHQKKRVLSKLEAFHDQKASIGHSPLEIGTTTVPPESSKIASLTCRLCRFVAGRRVELKFHQIFTCPLRERKGQPALTPTPTVSVRETLKSLALRKE